MATLKDILKSRNLTLGDVHRGTGISPSMVSRVFSGKRSPGADTEEKMASYLGLRLDQFRELWKKNPSQSEP